MYIFTQSESQLAYKHRKELWCAVVITSRAVLRFETYRDLYGYGLGATRALLCSF